MPSTLAAGWDIVTHFATEQWTVPEVHSILQECLGDQYTAGEWDEPLDTVLGAEGDADAALAALAALCKKWPPSESCEVAKILLAHCLFSLLSPDDVIVSVLVSIHFSC